MAINSFQRKTLIISNVSAFIFVFLAGGGWFDEVERSSAVVATILCLTTRMRKFIALTKAMTASNLLDHTG